MISVTVRDDADACQPSPTDSSRMGGVGRQVLIDNCSDESAPPQPCTIFNAARQRYGDLELVMLQHDIEEGTHATRDVEYSSPPHGNNHLRLLRLSKE